MQKEIYGTCLIHSLTFFMLWEWVESGVEECTGSVIKWKSENRFEKDIYTSMKQQVHTYVRPTEIKLLEAV